jgi:hypothetical protein
MLKRISGALAALILACIVLTPTPASALGNVDCAAKNADGAYVCLLSKATASADPGKVWLNGIEVWVGGNAATLEGGSCADNPAVKIKSIEVWSQTPNLLWGPRTGNLCKSQGYSKTYDVSPSIKVNCNAAFIKMDYVLRDNFGTDVSGTFFMDVETC